MQRAPIYLDIEAIPCTIFDLISVQCRSSDFQRSRERCLQLKEESKVVSRTMSDAESELPAPSHFTISNVRLDVMDGSTLLSRFFARVQ
jgi:hypothetical protein